MAKRMMREMQTIPWTMSGRYKINKMEFFFHFLSNIKTEIRLFLLKSKDFIPRLQSIC